jgi:hypothetical protein
MGQYLGIMLDDLISNLVYPKILVIFPWEDQIPLFQSLKLCNKAWKRLIDSSSQWLHTKFCLLVLHFEQQVALEAKRRLQWKNREFGSYYMYKGENYYISSDDCNGASNGL